MKQQSEPNYVPCHTKNRHFEFWKPKNLWYPSTDFHHSLLKWRYFSLVKWSQTSYFLLKNNINLLFYSLTSYPIFWRKRNLTPDHRHSITPGVFMTSEFKQSDLIYASATVIQPEKFGHANSSPSSISEQITSPASTSTIELCCDRIRGLVLDVAYIRRSKVTRSSDWQHRSK